MTSPLGVSDAPPQRRPLRRFLAFAGISGLGWLLDAMLLLGLIGLAGLPPGVANLISSCTAALSVFLVSRQTLFDRAARHFAWRVVAYVAYSLTVILLASLAVRILVPQLAGWLRPGEPALPHDLLVAAAAAKVLVTPPQLLLNFFASRFLSERRFERASLR